MLKRSSIDAVPPASLILILSPVILLMMFGGISLLTWLLYYLDLGHEFYLYISPTKTERYVDQISTFNLFFEHLRFNVYFLIENISIFLDILFTIIIIFVMKYLVVGPFFNRAEVRSVTFERTPRSQGAAQMSEHRVSFDPLKDVDMPFSGVITSIDELGMGKVKFLNGDKESRANFTPDVTWHLSNPDWLKPGALVKGRLYPTKLGYKISLILPGGAA